MMEQNQRQKHTKYSKHSPARPNRIIEAIPQLIAGRKKIADYSRQKIENCIPGMAQIAFHNFAGKIE